MFPVRRVWKYISIIFFYYIDTCRWFASWLFVGLVRVSFYLVADKKEITFPNNRNGKSRESQKWHFLASTTFANAKILINKRKKNNRAVSLMNNSIRTGGTNEPCDLFEDFPWPISTEMGCWKPRCGVVCRVASRLLSAPDYLSIRGTRDERSGPRRLLRLK